MPNCEPPSKFDELEARLTGLCFDTRWGSANWPAPLRALLSDPGVEI